MKFSIMLDYLGMKDNWIKCQPFAYCPCLLPTF